MAFPKPIDPSPGYQIYRDQRKGELLLSIKRGMGIKILIVFAEILGWFFFGSFALLFDGLASLIDILFSFALLFGVHFAERPPDRSHPFGHGRFEPLAGLQLAVLMIVLGGALAFQQLFSAVQIDSNEVISPFAWLIPLFSIILLEWNYQSMKAYANKNNSSALLAEAFHYRIDALNSFLAVIVLLLGVFLPAWSGVLDHLGAMAIAILMVILGVFAAWKNMCQLVDQRPSQEYFDLVRESASQVDGVLGIEKILIQLSGPDAHVDIDVEVDPKLTVEESHKISQHVRQAIRNGWPQVREVIVHIEPHFRRT